MIKTGKRITRKRFYSDVFKKAFLFTNTTKFLEVIKASKTEVGQAAIILAKAPDTNTETLARTIANNLAAAIAPTPQEDTTLNTTKRRTRRP